MSQRDLYHEAVRQALLAEGWALTHDPFTVPYGETNVFIDPGADAPLGAERGTVRIAVEVKTFLGGSRITELERALGQYVLYRSRLKREDPGRLMYLAVPALIFQALFDIAHGRDLISDLDLRLIVFDPQKKEIVRWTPHPILMPPSATS